MGNCLLQRSSRCCTYFCHSHSRHLSLSFYARHVRNSVINLDADMQKRFGFSSISYFACFFSCVFCASARFVSCLHLVLIAACCLLFLLFQHFLLSCTIMHYLVSERLSLVSLRFKLCI